MSKPDPIAELLKTVGCVLPPNEIGLRDYFAAVALSIGEGVWEGKDDDAYAEMARSCYRIADAMLAERERVK